MTPKFLLHSMIKMESNLNSIKTYPTIKFPKNLSYLFNNRKILWHEFPEKNKFIPIPLKCLFFTKRMKSKETQNI